MDAKTLAVCTGATGRQAELHAATITEAMAAYDINTRLRQAAFLAQIGHESGGLRWLIELWGPTPTQARYEGRKDLGNTQPGDGKKYRGHGFIQVTGRYNHARARDRLRGRWPHLQVPDFEESPELLAQPLWAAYSAADYWDAAGCNKYADVGDFDGVSDVINKGRKTSTVGDANGYADRARLYKLALGALT